MSRGVFTLVAGNLGSKILALAREVLFAAWFGTGSTAVGFRVAQTLYLLPVQALIGDSLSAGLMPLYRRLREEDPDRARTLVLLACAYAVAFSALVSSALYLGASTLTHWVAPGASEDAKRISSGLLRILALSTPFYIIGGVLSYVEAALGRFAGIAARPILINVGSIAGAGLAVWTGQDRWLAIGLVVCHVVLFVWTILSVRRLDRLSPTRTPSRGDVLSIGRRFVAAMLPLLGLPLAAQINLVVERIVSSWLGSAVIPSVDYARFLTDTMIQLIAVPLGIVTMATHGGSSRADLAQEHVRKTALFVLLISFPIATFIGAHAEPIVRLLFARGAFDEHSVSNTSEILRWMGLGLAANIPAYYLVRGLNSQLRNREALAATIIGCLANMTVNLALWPILGPQTIGIGLGAYGACIGVFCLSRLRLWPSVRRLVLKQTMIWTACFGLLWSLPALPTALDLLVGAAVVTLVWLASVRAIPELVEAFAPIGARLSWLPWSKSRRKHD